MKTMTCKQLGGACDITFKADSFDQIAKLSREHGMEMYAKGDTAHIDAMTKMSDLMQDATDMEEWMAARLAEFDAL